MKKLPEHVADQDKKDDKPKTEEKSAAERRRAVKMGFILGCLEDGVPLEQIEKRAAEVGQWFEKRAGGLEDLGGLAGMAALGVPLGAGGLMGYAAAKAHNAVEAGDAKPLRLENRLALLRQMAADAKQKAKLKDMQARYPGQIVDLG